MPARPESISLEPELQRRTAAELFNHSWTLMDKQDRSPRQTELMIHAAHASRFMWENAGSALNHARGEWQVARAYAVAERAEPALHHAQLCLEIAQTAGLGGFDVACGHEAIARALAVGGDAAGARDHERAARELAESLADSDERDVVLRDLATLPR